MEPLNLPAVLLGTVAAFVWGMILYHPRVLGGVWARGSGIEPGGPPPVLAFVLQVLGLLALALVVGMTATISYLGTAVLAILAVALFVMAGGAFHRKSPAALAIEGLYAAVAGALMIVVQGVI